VLFQSIEAIHEETFPPATNDFTAAVEANGNLVVVQALGGQQDHLGALDLKIR